MVVRLTLGVALGSSSSPSGDCGLVTATTWPPLSVQLPHWHFTWHPSQNESPPFCWWRDQGSEGSNYLPKIILLVIKNLFASAGDLRDAGLIPRLGRSLEEGMQPTPLFLPGESHGQMSLAGYSP